MEKDLKSEDKENIGKNTDKKMSKPDKELYWIFGVMIAVIAIFLVSFTFSQKSNSFDYKGLSFQKEMFGDIPLYKHTYLTGKVIRSTAQVVRSNEASPVIVALRNDPRKLEGVPVDGKIEYPGLEEFIYITLDSSPGLLCDYGTIALHELSSFISQNGFVVKAGISNESSAKEQKTDYISCENRPNRMVISYKSGNATSVVREGNCYTITVADCDILAPTEKFIVQSLLDAKNQTSP